MDNEINLFDMLLAKKLGGGGGSVSPIVFTATQWSELPQLSNIRQYFPANIDPNELWPLGKLEFSFNGLTQKIPIFLAQYEIVGGVLNSSGTGAIINLDFYDTWGVASAWTNIMGSWTDITSAVQQGASDIKLTLYK